MGVGRTGCRQEAGLRAGSRAGCRVQAGVGAGR